MKYYIEFCNLFAKYCQAQEIDKALGTKISFSRDNFIERGKFTADFGISADEMDIILELIKDAPPKY